MAPPKKTDTENKDVAVKGTATPSPNDRPTWEPSKQPGQTDRDPLASGAQPGPFLEDPTDNRAIGTQSAAGVTVPDEGDVSPKNADAIVTATGVMTGDPSGKIAQREIEQLEDEDVVLTADHYIEGEVFAAGAVLEGYTGPKSRNMRLVDAREVTAKPQATFKRAR